MICTFLRLPSKSPSEIESRKPGPMGDAAAKGKAGCSKHSLFHLDFLPLKRRQLTWVPVVTSPAMCLWESEAQEGQWLG